MFIVKQNPHQYLSTLVLSITLVDSLCHMLTTVELDVSLLLEHLSRSQFPVKTNELFL